MEMGYTGLLVKRLAINSFHKFRIDKIMRVILSSLIMLFFSLYCLAQSSNEAINKDGSVRLDLTKPSAYITFEKFGERKPQSQGESNQGVWLRFHNNTKWNLNVNTLGCTKEYGDCIVFHKVQRLPNYEDKIKNSDVPTGYRMAHMASVWTIESGKSLLFSVPKEHLAKGLFILVDFNYDWEQSGNTGGGDLTIVHKASFFSWKLPSEK